MVATAALAGCSGESTQRGQVGVGLIGLEDVVVASEPVVTPGLFWRQEAGILSAATLGSVCLFLPDPATEPLTVILAGAPGRGSLPVRLRLDEASVGDDPVILGSTPTAVVIPEDLLPAGRHLLWLEVDPAWDGEGAALRLSDLSWSFGAAEPRPARWRPGLARHLEFGFLPIDSDWRLSGTLMVGPGVTAQPIRAERPSRLGFRLVNDSSADARFRLRVGEEDHIVTLAPGSHQPFEVPIDPGTHLLELEVEGDPNGLFLWGMPRLKLTAPSPAPAPTVVLVTLDTTRRDAVAPWAAPGRTPHIAEIAAKATAFDHAWAVSPWTLPSHASIFTGLLPSEHGAGVWADRLPEVTVTLAERLRDAGYLGIGLAGGRLASFRFGLGQGFVAYRDPRGGEVAADVLTDACLVALDVAGDEPLFLFVNYFDPHAHYSAPPEFQALTGVAEHRRNLAGVPIWESFAESWQRGTWAAIVDGRAGLPEAGLAYLRALYDAEVEFMDHHLGRLVEELRRRDRWDGAMVVIVADHGEALGERGRFTHSVWLDPPILEVPLLVKWPGQRHPARVGLPVSHLDLPGTILAAVGLESAPGNLPVLGPKGAPGLTGRGPLIAEEHSSRLHQLPPKRKIADHLYALQWADRREVFWQGAVECESGAPGAWIAGDCMGEWEERLQALPSALQVTAGLAADYDVGDISPEEAELLRALGYLE